MACEITIPRLGWNMEEGIFVGWLKADGQSVAAGEPLYNLEGDKATQEIESLEAGILRIPPHGPKDGEKVAVGAIVGYLVAPDEPCPFDSNSSRQPSSAPINVIEPRKQAISPRARRVARELGVDPKSVVGSGITGRIVECDIRAAATVQVKTGPVPARASAQVPAPEALQAASSADYQDVALSSIRKTIAMRMLESKQTTAAVTITTTVDASNLVNLRRQFKAVFRNAEPTQIGYTDIIVKLTAMALEKHPMLNSRWLGNQIQVWRSIHIGIAVDTEAGLMVPVIHDVPRLTLRELAAHARTLAERCRAGKLTTAELSGGTFTISNLGQLGVEMFTPLINPPECAILGLGRIQNQVVVENKQFVERDRMVLSLSFDHRIVDGAPAARFLQDLGKLIENPSPWLLS